jgi:succinyl-CoA synthetase beta subunit
MKLFEYQGKQLFETHDISIPQGKIIESKSDLSGFVFPCILKAQVLIGGRGKAGGIQTAQTLDEATEKLSQIQGMSIRGLRVKKVLAEEKIGIKKELYLSITLDRSKKMPLIMMSGKGGMDIESVPDNLIFKEWIHPFIGVQPFHLKNILSHNSH